MDSKLENEDVYVDNFRVTKGTSLWTAPFDIDDDEEMLYVIPGDITVTNIVVQSVVTPVLSIGVTELLASTIANTSTATDSALVIGGSEILASTSGAQVTTTVSSNTIDLGIIETISHSCFTHAYTQNNYGNLFIDGETSIEDESGTHTITNVGGVSISTVTKKHGASSINFNTGGSLTIPDHTDFEFGTGVFTIDFWINANKSNGDWIFFASTSITCSDAAGNRIRAPCRR